ncbi:uncharacterized protein LOC127504143 isoform X42 [Ctenopharyngodon idella]|uniref:uncharacterized protein LOC127504143 isoform X33 n=1 Tax=Ctenopharyngodon idella TaxID=7959 RepID=UPI002231FB6A|nr:uncharacterized protein LOC127504143 isoform X33 [Ctenopharyngodon idella]XP_051734582.1 uncharacterized protein LOC127504143 isoform X34 [Ctenopharyngodon idella]XP_051734583.1 uncharacterized protein LOC127504143 isoform X35 [Ctenopharyngodon idella]XP_051734584.1 uncharacterized protein LOC127504143 isoform X36 [Ctenopharyngodon idella]XP_051734585.1 uncharacterized protein LOC127504143 isoform X37 [Ctenopharyngodon idella]XP_051734586.1 uncharacterized protein LOC127504143 isoform X38 [
MSKRRTRLSPEAEAIQFILSGGEKPCFKVKWISDFKGRGVFTCTPIEKGSFVVEYRGELISQYEQDKRQKKYTEKQNAFLFDFELNNVTWCIDASREDGSLGRLVNDCNKSPNCKMKRLTVQGKPHLCLFAIENIQAETEITYDYGDSQWPWRNLTPSGMIQSQPSGDPEVSERSSSTFQQTPSGMIQSQPSGDPEVSERSSSTFQQTPSGMIQSQPSGDPEVSERSSSTFQQANHSTGIASFHHVLTAEQISNDMTDESSDATDYDDANYVPDSSGNSSDTSYSSRDLKIIDNHLPHRVLKEKSLGIDTAHSSDSTNSSKEQRSFSSSKISSGHCSSVISCSDSSSEKTSHSSINVTSLPNTAKRSKYNKKQYCLYCNKAISKLARHLESAHSTQLDVAKAFSFKKRSRERKDLLRSLKKRGNFNHNATVASSGVGEMVACRRPTRDKQSNDFSHCKFCQGLYARDSLWRHVRNCPQKSVEVETRVGQKRIHIDLPKADTVHDAVWKIACEMNQDDISLVVRSERDILSLGESMYNGRKPNEKRNDYIRQKMREMARLLITARATTPLKSTEDLVMPSNFPHVIQAVRSVAGYDLDSNSYKTPSLALKLGHSLAKVAGIVQCNAIIANRNAVAESAKQFSTLYEKRWAESISSAALGTLHQAKWNKPHVLPFTQDVSLLHKFLATERAKCMKDLEEEPNIKSFGNLAQVTLTQVVLFNRRRQGEVSKMELQAFTSRNRTELNPDIMMGLTEFERKVAKYFDRVEIRGKRSRMVPVLLTPDMITAMDLLIKNRNECQVHTENVYLFARPCVLSHYRGSDCFRKYSKRCGAKNPESLTSTRLRKQVATLSTVLNLKENEMDQLATFLGHDIRVHREFYRLPESTLQLAKVSKLLIAMEKGRLSDLQGKGLDDIEINPGDEVGTSDDDSSEETIADLHQHEGSRTETSGDRTLLRHSHASTTLDHLGGTSASTVLDNVNVSNTQPRHDSQQNTALQMVTSQTSSKGSTAKQAGKVRSKWTGNEVKAVERHMIHFITSCKVPGKKDCDSCLQAEPVALKDRDWVAIKYYIHNRIISMKRKMNR